MQSTRDWAEEDAYINIDDPENPTINFYVYWRQDQEDFVEDYNQAEYDSLEELSFDPEGDLTLTQCKDMVDKMLDSNGVVYNSEVFREIG